eukprot:Gb_01398 [translate_table: standard]
MSGEMPQVGYYEEQHICQRAHMALLRGIGRHAHHVLFEKSDLFFVCMLKPLSSHIVKDDVEIHAAQWMPLEEFAAQPFYQKHNMLKKMLDICIANFENHYKGFSSFQMYSGCDEHPSYFYYNAKDIK